MFELFKTDPVFVKDELTKDKAMKIYYLIKQYGDVDMAYKNNPNSSYPYEHFEIIDKELSRIYEEYLSGNLNITSDLLEISTIIADFDKIMLEKSIKKN